MGVEDRLAEIGEPGTGQRVLDAKMGEGCNVAGQRRWGGGQTV